MRARKEQHRGGGQWMPRAPNDPHWLCLDVTQQGIAIPRNDANNGLGRPEAALLSLIQHPVFSQIPLPYYHLPSLFLYRLSLLAPVDFLLLLITKDAGSHIKSFETTIEAGRPFQGIHGSQAAASYWHTKAKTPPPEA